MKRIIEANENAGDEWNGGGFNNGHYQEPSLKWLLDTQCDTYWTPIMFAARYGHLAIVKILAQKGAKLELTSTYNSLHAACFGQSIETVRYLVEERGCDVNPQT